eukprot:10885147-Alexandrium_andersonii.AAC.1
MHRAAHACAPTARRTAPCHERTGARARTSAHGLASGPHAQSDICVLHICRASAHAGRRSFAHVSGPLCHASVPAGARRTWS